MSATVRGELMIHVERPSASKDTEGRSGPHSKCATLISKASELGLLSLLSGIHRLSFRLGSLCWNFFGIHGQVN